MSDLYALDLIERMYIAGPTGLIVLTDPALFPWDRPLPAYSRNLDPRDQPDPYSGVARACGQALAISWQATLYDEFGEWLLDLARFVHDAQRV